MVSEIISGAGIGLRSPHVDYLLTHHIDGLWLELLADNWFAQGGLDAHYLREISCCYPLTLHCVGLSLGGVEPIDRDYLLKLKGLMNQTNARWLSDHLCFNHVQKHYLPDLLPLPYTEEMVDHVASRIRYIQDILGVQILLENVSSYLEYKNNSMQEYEFLNTICEQADCYMLLDINNVFVSQRNHGISAEQTISNINVKRVREVHLAGHRDKGNIVVDTHDNFICDEVWKLYKNFMHSLDEKIPTLIEWDSNIPAIDVLLNERQKAQLIMNGEECPVSEKKCLRSMGETA